MTKHTLSIARLLGLAISASVIAFAVIALYRQIEHMTIAGIATAIERTDTKQIIISLVATFISFTAMAATEMVAQRSAGFTLPLGTAAIAGAGGNALANTLGFPALTLSAWRYKVYNDLGLSLLDIASISGIAFIGIILGFAGTSSSALLSNDGLTTLTGIFPIVCISTFILWTRRHRGISFKKWSITLPGAKSNILLLVIGMIDTLAAISAAYVLLPSTLLIAFPHFALVYICAVLFGIAGHTPGGLGVFEASIMIALGAWGRSDILAALVLYRIIYNLLPFILAVITVAVYAVHRRRLIG